MVRDMSTTFFHSLPVKHSTIPPFNQSISRALLLLGDQVQIHPSLHPFSFVHSAIRPTILAPNPSRTIQSIQDRQLRGKKQHEGRGHQHQH